MSSEQQKNINPWNYKPWWCQPWSILLTGISILVGSWLLFKTLWLTAVVAIPLLIWMGYFLLVWPKLIVESSFFDSQN